MLKYKSRHVCELCCAGTLENHEHEKQEQQCGTCPDLNRSFAQILLSNCSNAVLPQPSSYFPKCTLPEQQQCFISEKRTRDKLYPRNKSSPTTPAAVLLELFPHPTWPHSKGPFLLVITAVQACTHGFSKSSALGSGECCARSCEKLIYSTMHAFFCCTSLFSPCSCCTVRGQV